MHGNLGQTQALCNRKDSCSKNAEKNWLTVKNELFFSLPGPKAHNLSW